MAPSDSLGTTVLTAVALFGGGRVNAQKADGLETAHRQIERLFVSERAFSTPTLLSPSTLTYAH
jgi:hypothetical protein